jgi:hypothetical protein
VTTFYPSARIRLKLRTEEFENTAALVSRLPPAVQELPDSGAPTVPPSQPSTPSPDDSANEALARNTERRTQLEGRRDAISAEEFERQIAQLDEERAAILRQNAQAPEEEGSEPESVSGTPPDDLTVVGEIEPISATIELNGLATADRASVTLDFIDAPIDPRLLRAAHVELTIGLVSADDFEAGMERAQRRPDGSLTSLVSRDDGGDVARFVGFVDDWGDEYSDQGDTVQLTCRDMSAPLRDIRLQPGVSINMALPLDQGVADLLNRASATTRGVTVRFVGEGTAPVPVEAAPQRRRPRRGRVNRRVRRSGQNMTIWDHITDVVRQQGLVPMMRGYELLIADPRTLYTEEGVRRMVYGRNLERLEFTRKLSGVKVPTIEVRAHDSERGRTIWARYPTASGQPASGVLGVDNPPAPTRANEVPPSGANPDEAVRVMSISGVTDPDRLGQVARSVYEEIGRQEIEGTFVTADAWSYDNTPQFPDLLTMRPGDAVTLLVARVNAGGEDVGSDTSLARLEAMDRARRINYMTSLGWTREVATRFANLQEASGFQTTFRVRNLRLAWDHTSGLGVTCDFFNYIVIRDENADASEET